MQLALGFSILYELVELFWTHITAAGPLLVYIEVLLNVTGTFLPLNRFLPEMKAKTGACSSSRSNGYTRKEEDPLEAWYVCNCLYLPS